MKQRIVPRRGRRGLALMSVVVGSVSAVGAVAVLMTLATFSSDTANIERRNTEAQYLAMGAVESAKRDLLDSIANWDEPPTYGQMVIGADVVQFEIGETGLDTVRTDASGIQTLVKGYEIRATGVSHGSQTLAHRVLNVEATPIFQFAVFYDNDLEVFPGPNMNLRGRIHTNGDLFMGSNATLTLNSNFVRSAGQIFRYRKDAPDQSPGTVNIRRWVEDPFDNSVAAEYVRMHSEAQMDSMGVPTESGYDSQFTRGLDLNGDGDFYDSGEWLPWGPGALHYWSEPGSEDDFPDSLPYPYPDVTHSPEIDNVAMGGHTVLDQTHSIGEAHVPGIDSIAMYRPRPGGNYRLNQNSSTYYEVEEGEGTHARGYYHANADLVVITNNDGTWDAFDRQGFSVRSRIQSAVRIISIYDARQAEGNNRNTRVTEIDLQRLGQVGGFPANGLLYSAHYGMGTRDRARGIKLVNGAELQSKLTVVSEGTLYVKGDYNTVNKKPAAVIGDAVNLLSNAWNDGKRPGQLPNANRTTYNTAIITGNHETVGSQYNGGFENLPRFHENWSGVDCRITGAFVNTWYSKFATGLWVYGSDRYQAPNRVWSYDPMFNNVEMLPPFTPLVVGSEDVVSW